MAQDLSAALPSSLAKALLKKSEQALDEEALREVVRQLLEDHLEMGELTTPQMEAVYAFVQEHGRWVAALRHEGRPDETAVHQDIAIEELARYLALPETQQYLRTSTTRILRQFLVWASRDCADRQARLAWWFRLQKAVQNEGSLQPVPQIRAL